MRGKIIEKEKNLSSMVEADLIVENNICHQLGSG